MKVAGWIFIAFAILNFIAFIAAMAIGEAEAAGRKMGEAIMLGVLGAYLVHKGKQKEKEEKEIDDWNRS